MAFRNVERQTSILRSAPTAGQQAFAQLGSQSVSGSSMDQMSFSFRLSPHNRDYTTRNILSLEERIDVIREYERHPVYQHIAEKFNCSAKQIKNIVANKEALLSCYATSKTDGSTSEARIRRQQKIDFLDKVIYEYLQRALYHDLPLNATTVRAKALEVKERIAIENFYPNDEWMQNFKTTYKVAQFEQITLRPRAGPLELKKPSLKSIDIIYYVSQREKESQCGQREQQRTPDENGNHAAHRGPASEQDHVVDVVKSNDPDAEEVTVLYEVVDDDGLTTSLAGVTHSNATPSVKAEDADEELGENESESSVDERLEKPTTPEPLPPLPDIHSYEEALRHLKVLEDFAMIQDNYRAIGLITQLGQVFKHPPKNEDFES